MTAPADLDLDECRRLCGQRANATCPDDCEGIECSHVVRYERATYALANHAAPLLAEVERLRAENAKLTEAIAADIRAGRWRP